MELHVISKPLLYDIVYTIPIVYQMYIISYYFTHVLFILILNPDYSNKSRKAIKTRSEIGLLSRIMTMMA